MKKRWISGRLILYEVRNILGNPFTIFFSTIFPILMCYLLSVTTLNQLPEYVRVEAATSIFITMSLVVPMSIFMIGYGANYSQELEKDVPLRMNLFGFTESKVMIAKILAHLLFFTIALALYFIVSSFLVKVQVPKTEAIFVLVGTLYVLAVIFFILAHGIATIFKKFGPTYAITMLLYFMFMILCGMMGMSTDLMPKAIQVIADTLPMTYVTQDFIKVWQGSSYNFVPFIQSMVFFAAIAGIILLFGIRKEKRVLNTRCN